MNNRLALVIGNAAYEWARPLKNPVNDASEVAGILKRLGFRLVTIAGHNEFHANLGLVEMARALADFSVAAEKAETAIIFFAGHGVEVDGQNYLLPIDANLEHIRRLYFETIRLADIRQTLNRASHYSLMILDACRDDPFKVPMRGLSHTRSSSVGRGFAHENVAGNHGIAFAAQEGTLAYDSLRGSQNSPYTQALIKHLETPDIEIRMLFGLIKDEVMTNTGNQVPAFHSGFGGQEFFLKGHGRVDRGDAVYKELKQLWKDFGLDRSEDQEILKSFAARAKGTPAEDMAEARLKTVKAERVEREEANWNKASFENNIAAYSTYLTLWPDGTRVLEAKNRIELLREEQVWLLAKEDPDQIRGYLRDFPSGRYVEEAQTKIADLEHAKRQAEADALRSEGRFLIEAPAIQNQKGRWFLPGGGSIEWFQDFHDAPEMVVVPPGSFSMGSSDGEPERESLQKGGESPRHEVRIASPLAVGRCAVTRQQFAAFVNASAYEIENGAHVWTDAGWTLDPTKSWRNPGFEQDDKHPVVCVNWHDSKAYVEWLSRQSRQTYRLLAEAEWEYVCRAGTSTPFWWGSTITSAQANYNCANVYEGGGSKGERSHGTMDVNCFGAKANCSHCRISSEWTRLKTQS